MVVNHFTGAVRAQHFLQNSFFVNSLNCSQNVCQFAHCFLFTFVCYYDYIKKPRLLMAMMRRVLFFLLVRSKLARHFGLSIRNRYTINNNVNFHGVYVCV